MNPLTSPPQPVEVETKPWYESRVIWFNVLSLVILAVGLVIDNATLLEVPRQAVVVLGIAVAVGNAALRLITHQPVASSTGQHKVVQGHATTGMSDYRSV
jgi:hypothetical protein